MSQQQGEGELTAAGDAEFFFCFFFFLGGSELHEVTRLEEEEDLVQGQQPGGGLAEVVNQRLWMGGDGVMRMGVRRGVRGRLWSCGAT
jgi:hypothetical protein